MKIHNCPDCRQPCNCECDPCRHDCLVPDCECRDCVDDRNAKEEA